MKKAFLIAALAMAGGSLWGQGFTATQHHAPVSRTPKVVVQRETDGAVQKAARMGNPLQALNLFAPKEYGNGSECVYYDENDHFQSQHHVQSQPKGIRLFAFAW